MTEVGEAAVPLVLRRFENEELELTFDRMCGAERSDTSPRSCPITAVTEGPTVVYRVLLPEFLSVRRVDWRRFAYDHPMVAELLGTCVRDNVDPLLFEPWSDALEVRMRTILAVALGDLTSVFDTEAVRLERREPLGFLITIEGEHKNGQRMSYHFDMAVE